jgi:hypothetical protein
MAEALGSFQFDSFRLSSVQFSPVQSNRIGQCIEFMSDEVQSRSRCVGEG